MRLPTFVIIGTAKGGTTALTRFLQAHPQVHIPYKEPNYFSGWDTRVQFHNRAHPERRTAPRRLCGTLDEYTALFSRAGDARALGEASVSYLPDEHAATLMRQTIPAVKLIAFFRQPVDRAFSHFVMTRRDGREPDRDFKTAMLNEPERLAARWHPFLCYGLLSRYSVQLARYQAQFPPEQLRLYLYEDWNREPERVWAELMPYLGIDASHVPNFRERFNAGDMARPGYEGVWSAAQAAKRWLRPVTSLKMRRILGRPLRRLATHRPTLDAGLRSELTQTLFRDDILRFQDMIGRDLSSWLR